MSELTFTHDQVDQMIKVAKAIGSTTRFRIIKMLAEQPRDISKLAEDLSQTEANVSAQVKTLQSAGLVTCEYKPGVHGVRKICTTKITDIAFQLVESTVEATEDS